jgi:hypothetical protein
VTVATNASVVGEVPVRTVVDQLVARRQRRLDQRRMAWVLSGDGEREGGGDGLQVMVHRGFAYVAHPWPGG